MKGYKYVFQNTKSLYRQKGSKASNQLMSVMSVVTLGILK